MGTRDVLAVSAGLGQPSSTRMLVDRLGEALVTDLAGRDLPTVVHTVELREVAHDIIDTMLTGVPTGNIQPILDRLARADGVILGTPVFSTSCSGLFKSFMDILDTGSLAGTPTLLSATGGTPRHSLALEYSLRPLLAYLHADIASTAVFATADDWDDNADRAKPLGERIGRATAQFAEMLTEQEKDPDPRGIRSFETLR